MEIIIYTQYTYIYKCQYIGALETSQMKMPGVHKVSTEQEVLLLVTPIIIK